MIAKTFEVKYTVARVRNPESAGSIDVDARGITQTQVGIDMIISPERVVAQELAKTIQFPDAAELDYYADGKVMLLAVNVSEAAEITNQPLNKLPLPKGCILVGIKRPDGEFVLPGGKHKVRAGDKVYLIGSVDVMREAIWFLQRRETRVNRVIILGGGLIGLSLATILERSGRNSFISKIIEKDDNRFDELNRSLSKTIVLQGDGTDLSYFNEEEIAEAVFPEGLLVGTIVRDKEVIIPDGNTRLKANDRLIIFAMPKVCSGLDRFFACQMAPNFSAIR